MRLFGTYPTMITPYKKDGSVDYDALENLVEWYYKAGCEGIFAVCQSSEIFFLSLEERVRIAATVRKKADELAKSDPSREPMTIVISGHVSDSFCDQVKELTAMAETKPDALILISNRMDKENTSNKAWISDVQRLMYALPENIPLGVYECPYPYKRLLSDEMLRFCAESGRFLFMKDTCCDADVIARRIEITSRTPMKLLNANAQTLLASLRAGGYGYCGIMANFHPQLYVWLCNNFQQHPEKAELLQSFLGTSAFTESLAYPCTAKYHLDTLAGVKMEWISRSRNVQELTDYQKSCIQQMETTAKYFKSIMFCTEEAK